MVISMHILDVRDVVFHHQIDSLFGLIDHERVHPRGPTRKNSPLSYTSCRPKSQMESPSECKEYTPDIGSVEVDGFSVIGNFEPHLIHLVHRSQIMSTTRIHNEFNGLLLPRQSQMEFSIDHLSFHRRMIDEFFDEFNAFTILGLHFDVMNKTYVDHHRWMTRVVLVQ